MSTCASCGQENPEIARFCLACGAQLTDTPGAVREERRIVSVIFVDLVGFTARSEQLDPEDVRAILTPYHDTVRAEIESFGGVVEKFIGDAVMGVFGAPTSHGDDPERAVRAALAVRDAVTELNDAQRLGLQIRMAINTGDAVVALTARPGLGEAMVAGDVVNTAARLQQTAPVGEIVVGEETYRSTRDTIAYESAEPAAAKGKAQPLGVWRVLSSRSESGERELSTAPFFGRSRELGLLEGTWERVALERRPHLITVLGAPGVGKTRLAAEFDRVVISRGGKSVRGRCLPYRERSAYGAFATQVKELAAIFDSDDVEVASGKLRSTVSRLVGEAEAEAVVAHLAILLGFETAATAPDRESLFRSARVFIEAVARDHPTALVFEDIHWADPSLLDLIELLAGRLHDLPILLLTLSRPELLDSRAGWGGGLLAYNALPLEPLPSEDAKRLAEHLLGHEANAAEVVEAAEGNPLFIEQLAAVMSQREGSQGTLPTTIRGLVSARLDALPATERNLLLDAAIVGKVFWRGALIRLTDEPETLPALLAALERRDLIRRSPTSSIEGDEEYVFKHVLIRDVAYELLPRARRQEGHARVARFVEESTPEVGEAAAALARHWRGAGEVERAVDYFVAAAEEAERGWAKGLAAMLYKEALQITSSADLERVRFLRRRLAVAQQAYIHTRDARILGRGVDEAS